MIYLELGILPVGDMIRQRRLNFLYYILNQENESILFKVFEKQSQNRSKNDWVSTVCRDLEEIGLKVTFEVIQQMSRGKWKNTVKIHIENNALDKLNALKKTHSKVKHLNHQKLEIQAYFLPNRLKVRKEEIQYIFKMRCKVINDVKMNQKSSYENQECRYCEKEKEKETQEHIYQCVERWKLVEREFENIPKYEKINDGNSREKIQVARIFKILMDNQVN